MWDEGKSGEELNSQVILGGGLPEPAQVNRTDEPDATVWSDRPLRRLAAPGGDNHAAGEII